MGVAKLSILLFKFAIIVSSINTTFKGVLSDYVTIIRTKK